MDMRAYEVEMIRDGKVKYFFIRNMETMEIELLPTRFLTHKTRAQESPNTVGSLARSICYYMNFCDGRQMGFTDVCQMDYEAQFNHFTDFLQWLKAGNHTKNLKKTPRNRTCNTYLKNVFGFFSFLEMAEDQFGPLQVLSYGTIHVANSVGVKRRLRFRSFAGYLKEEEREVRAAEKNEIVTILEACTNCRDQLLILMASELGFRIGELLGIDYTKDIDYETLLQNVAIVFQKTFLTRDSVFENIRMGSNASLDEVREAAKKAQIDDFIMSLPDGYDTKVGSFGSRFSGGEKQRIAIARAILKNAPILILDEATSAADPENQVEIDKAIENLCKGKTVIIVAHRLGAIKICDRVAVVENHTITCCGTHEEVRKNNAYYRKAWSDYEQARAISYQLEGGNA